MTRRGWRGCAVWAVLTMTAIGPGAQTAPAATPPPLLRAHGVRINVPDLDQAVAFYVDALGFEVERRERDAVGLRPDERHYTHVTLVRQPRSVLAASTLSARSGLTLRTKDIHDFVARAGERRIRLLESQIRTEQVGLAISFADPFGTAMSVMDEARKTAPVRPGASIYNFSLYLPEDGYSRAREFWVDRLGFVTRTDRFLPRDQPLFDAAGQWGFMLHMRAGVVASALPYAGYPQPLMQLATGALDAAVDRLRAAGAEFLSGCYDAFGRRCVAFREPFGTPIEVIELR
jgi:catechol 2,3-dioxygenase-like lactoylglutathione lyase family enzyme